jgi:hypothetical protein
VKGEFDLLEEQLAKASKEARGKKFVLDRYGNTIIMGKVDPNHLPPFTAHLQTSVKEEQPVKGSKVSSAKGGGEGDDCDVDGKKKRFVRVAGSRSVDESAFQPNLSLASTLSGVEHIPKVNPGVVVRSKVGEKSGDPIPEDNRRISKKTYLSKTGSNIQPSLASVEEFDSYSNLSSRMGTGNNQGIAASGKSKSKLRFDSSVKNIDSLPDIDPLEGSRSIVQDGVHFDLSDDDLGLGPTNTKGSGGSMILPKKPNEKQKSAIESLIQSPDGGKPRDRDLVKNMKTVADRKHLAAPPLGQSTGHGLTGINGEKSVSIYSIESGSYSSEWFQQKRKN